ncbi:MAG: hypothetical protein HUK00_01650 [Bacteroidaceae bacterium]|nr:hypothetical protein [Bacteroidaceae bacterium]
MNKLKFFSTLLCAVMGLSAWAQTTPNPPVGTHVYDIDGTVALAAGDYIALQCRDYNGGAGYYLNGATVKTATFGYDVIYQLEAAATGYYLKRVSTGKYLAGTSGTISEADAATGATAFTIAKPASISNWTTKYSDTDADQTLRFTVAGTSMFLNSQTTSSTPNYAAGTGGFSIWYVWKYTQSQVDDLKPKEQQEWVAKAQTVYNAVSVVTGCVGSYNATPEQIADLKTAIDNDDNDACKTLVEAIGDRIPFDNNTVYSALNMNTGLYLRAMDDNLLWAKSGVAFSESDARFQWMVYNDGTDNILYNIAQGGWANNTNSASGQNKHWQIVTDQSAMSYVEIVDAGTMFSFRDRDHAGITVACLHNNTEYNTGITNWNPAPTSPGSGWRFFPVKTLSDAVTASVSTLQEYSANIKLIQPYIEIYNNLNTLGGKRASEAEKVDFKDAIDALDPTTCQSIVESLETITLSNNKMYALETTRGNIIYYPAATADYAYSTGKASEVDHTQPNQQWAILTTAKGKYLYNVGADKFACEVETPDETTNKGRVGLNAEIATGDFDLVDNKATSAAYPWLLQLGTHQFNVSNGYAQPIITFWNSATDSGNQFRIVEVDDFDCTEAMVKITAYESNEAAITVRHLYKGDAFKTENLTIEIGSAEAAAWQPTSAVGDNRVGVTANIPAAQTITGDCTIDVNYDFDATALPFQLSDLSAGFKNDTKFYTLKIRDTKNVVYNSSVNYAQNSTTDPGLNAAKYFAFTGDNINGFKLYNLVAGADKAFGPDGTTGAFTTDGQLLWFENNSGKNIFHAVDTDNKYVNDNNNKLAYWVSNAGATDNGGNITFAVADADDLLKSAKMTFIGAVSPVTTTGKIGDYTQAYVDGLNAVISEVEALSTLEEVLAYTGTAPSPEYRLPAAGAFYRIKGNASGKYLSSQLTGGHSRPAIVDQSADEKGTIWYLDENNTLINFAAGVGIKETHTLAAYNETFHKWSFSPAAAGVPNLALVSDFSGSKYLCDWTDGYANRMSGDAVANRTAWQIEEVTAVPVIIGETAYASVCLPVPTIVPDGVEAWFGVSEGPDKVVLNKIVANEGGSTILPANCAVVLHATTPDTYNFVLADEDGTATSIFSGTTAAIATPANTMLLGQNGESKPVLVTFTDACVPGFQMYYTCDASELLLDFDDTTTAIEAAKRTDMREGEIYNLNGQQVTKANGLVIVNGHKFVVK